MTTEKTTSLPLARHYRDQKAEELRSPLMDFMGREDVSEFLSEIARRVELNRWKWYRKVTKRWTENKSSAYLQLLFDYEALCELCAKLERDQPKVVPDDLRGI